MQVTAPAVGSIIRWSKSLIKRICCIPPRSLFDPKAVAKQLARRQSLYLGPLHCCVHSSLFVLPLLHLLLISSPLGTLRNTSQFTSIESAIILSMQPHNRRPTQITVPHLTTATFCMKTLETKTATYTYATLEVTVRRAAYADSITMVPVSAASVPGQCSA